MQIYLKCDNAFATNTAGMPAGAAFYFTVSQLFQFLLIGAYAVRVGSK
jgi:hypothetical protein